MAHSELDHLLFALEPGDDLAADTPYLMRYRKLEPAYLALQQRGVSDTTELLRLLAFGRARGIGNWMSPEWTEHFDHWRTGSSTFDDLVVRLAAARERSAR